MLDPWIIEEILKKEEELRREREHRPAEMPLERHHDTGDRPVVTPPRDQESERGVIIIDI